MIVPLSKSVTLVPVLLSLVVHGLIGSLAVARADDDVVDAVGVDPRFVMSEQQFDQTVFNTRGTVVVAGAQKRPVVVAQSSPATQAKNQLETLLNAEIATIDLRCKLTEAQKKKLRLAGRGDIADLLARAMEVRRRCTSEPMTQQEYTKLTTEMQGLRMVIQSGSFGDLTLFRKTMRSLLSTEQTDLYRVLERERRTAMVTEALAINWGQNAKPVRLSAETQKKFLEVLLEHGHLPTNPNLYRHYIVLIEIGRLEDRLKPLLTEDEWQQLQFPLGQAKRVEQFLRTSGQWPIESADDEESSEATKE